MVVKSQRILSRVLRIVASAMLVGALGSHPYDYYVLLRWIACGTALFIAYAAYERHEKADGWVWVFGIMALFFNPIIPVHLSKSTWGPIDLIAAAIMIASVFALKFTPQDEEEPNEMRSEP